MDHNHQKRAEFEQAMLPHIDSAYNLARWISGNPVEAHDIVQESYLRAYRFYASYNGSNARAWLLAIVRNSCYNYLSERRRGAHDVEFDEEIHTVDVAATDADWSDPERALARKRDAGALERLIAALPPNYIEVLVLREIEGMYYREISLLTRVPIGTVMSRLARARARLLAGLCAQPRSEVTV